MDRNKQSFKNRLLAVHIQFNDPKIKKNKIIKFPGFS